MKIYLLLKIILFVLLFCFSVNGYSQAETPKDSISNELKEVLISTDAKAFSYQNGNIKMDVASNPVFNSVPNAVDLVSKLPTVLISADKENISVVGKGNALIYIDNQKVGIDDLNALAVADIKIIEIIKNPSSKYEANGRVVILITRKFSKKDSFRTEISEVASFRKNFNNYLGFNSNFKKDKLELKANFNYNRLNPWESHSVDYQIPTAEIVSKYDVSADTKRNQYVFGAGLFYKINEEDYFSFSVNSRLQSDTFPINTITDNKNKDVINNVVTFTDNDSKKNFVNSFVNYQNKIKTIDTQIFVGAQYSNFDQGLFTEVNNNFNDTQFKLSQIRDQKFQINYFSGRTDLEKKLKNEMKFEIGGLYSTAISKSDVTVFYAETNQNELSYYDFKEENLSGYTQFSGKIKKADFSIGFRIENSNVNGKFRTDELPLLKRNYTNFFPKAQFTFPIDSIKSISVNYARSITRPNYSSLSQGSTYINPYFLYMRNINLGPTFINEISATFQYNDKSVKLSYTDASDPVYNSFSFDDENNVMTFKDINFDKSSGFTVDFTLPFTYKFWTTTNSLLFILEKIEDDTAVVMASKPYSYFSSNNEFKLPKEYSLVVNLWGLTKQYTGVFITNPRFVVDIAVSKIFFKKWNCTLSCNNIFKNNIETEKFTINSINSKARYVVDNHEISIAIRYSFGKVKETDFKDKNADENSSRIR